MYDYILIGRGIAGSVLAMTLLDRNKKILVYDDPSLSCSSRIAGGLFNPIVFKRLNKVWKADELFPFAENFYSHQEKKQNASYLHAVPLTRVFSSQLEQNEWQITLEKPSFSKYISDENHLPEEVIHKLSTPFGRGSVNHCGYLDTNSFLNAVEGELLAADALKTETIEYSSVRKENDCWRIGNNAAKNIIFCDGWKMDENPWFNYIPMAPAKGEVMEIEIRNFPLNTILNAGCFVLPLEKNKFKVGATFEWDELNEEPTEKGKTELCQKLEALIKTPYKITNHYAGVRPSTMDRRPLTGEHPEQKGMYLFNGLGTRGVIIAPWLADNLVNHIETGSAIEPEADLKRFRFNKQ